MFSLRVSLLALFALSCGCNYDWSVPPKAIRDGGPGLDGLDASGTQFEDGGGSQGLDASASSDSSELDAGTDMGACNLAAGKNTCQNGGHCVATPDGFRCECPAGLNGEACEDIDDCTPGACSPGGTCIDGVDGFTCLCTAPGYKGSGTAACVDVDECVSFPCSTAYPCVQTPAPGYSCIGQLAEWPMPDSTPGAAHGPNYDVLSAPTLVIDKVTGLVWQKFVPNGVTTSMADATYLGCTGMRTIVGDACTWAEAKVYCANLVLAGKDDWRLPSKIELESIVDPSRVNPALDTDAFSGTAPLTTFWTSSEYGLAGTGWSIDFRTGGEAYSATSPGAARCVRGGFLLPGTPAGRYVVDGGMVNDTRTGLIWDVAVAPTTHAWNDAKAYCGGKSMRLPSLKELLTLVDPTRVGPSISPVFPDTPSSSFWSSSPVGTSGAWIVGFQRGETYNGVYTNASLSVRCVR